MLWDNVVAPVVAKLALRWTLPSKSNKFSRSLANMGPRVEARTGKIPLSGRYHCDLRKLEDDYILSERVLGTGVNGEVRLATSLSQPEQKFAVKSFHLSDRKNDVLLLTAEVENFLSLDHPHIARLCDVYESRQQLHLVMECMEGGELFDRLIEKKRFSEEEAIDALRQMLVALNYLHSHGIVHRDVKLENFVYDTKDGNRLKLIDFGLSQAWTSSEQNMSTTCGTVAYLPPEVISGSYTSQCDLWSVGVVGFCLLSGEMPFSGSQSVQMRKISKGEYYMKPAKWDSVSSEAKDFIKSLLEVDPSKRLSAQQALEHPWVARSCKDEQDGMEGVVEALREFSHATKFRKCCMEIMVWSLSNEDRAKVHDHFICLDLDKQGTISLSELRHVMVDKLQLVEEREVLQVFQALDYNNDQQIHYSDFLAAMLDTQIELSDDLLTSAFRRFDTDGSGFITADKLCHVLGSQVDGQSVETFVQEVDQNMDGRISFGEFAAYLKQDKIVSNTPSGSIFEKLTQSLLTFWMSPALGM